MKKLTPKYQNGDTFPSGHPAAPDNPIRLEPVIVTGRRPKSFLDRAGQFINDEIFLNKDNIRVRNYQKAEARNPNFSNDWDMASNIGEFMNVATGGLLNRLSLTQNARLIYDLATGEDVNPLHYGSSWWGNTGIVPQSFAQEHPYLSMAINGIADVGMSSMLNRFRTTSSFRDPNKVYHADKGNGSGFTGSGAYVKNGRLYPGQTRLEGQANYTWWNEGKPFSTGFNFKKPMTRMIIADKDAVPELLRVREQPYRIGQWNPNVRKSFVRTSEMVSTEPFPMQNADVYRRIPRTELWFRTNTAGPFGRYGVQNFLQNPHIGSWSLNAPRSLFYDKKRIGYKNYPDTYFGEVTRNNFDGTPPNNSRFGAYIGSGDEQTVFRDAQNPTKVLKISVSSGYSKTPELLNQQTVVPMMLRNQLPGSVKISPVGYVYSSGYKGYFPVFQQDYIQGVLPENLPNFEQVHLPKITKQLSSQGWLPDGYEFTNGTFSAYDFQPQNMAETNGSYRFIDVPVFRNTK